MPALTKATLLAVEQKTDTALPGQTAIPVQFNPASLHYTLQSVRDQGATPAQQVQQHLGSGNLTVSMDLHFDTADDGTDVRLKTDEVAKFMRPAPASTTSPPRVKFHWGNVVVVGVMASYQQDIDLFSPDGVPLRSKVSISINAQDPGRAADTKPSSGPGAKTGAGATAPGSVGGALGTVGFGAGLSAGAGLGAGVGLSAGASLGGLSLGDRTGIAIGGESAAEFAARMGADATAWRGIAARLDSTISIDAGTEIDFSSDLSASAGVGSAVGVESGGTASVEDSVGLGGEAATPARGGAAPGTVAGLALAAAGGVQAAVAMTEVAASTSAVSDAKKAYGLPATPTAQAVAEVLVPPAALQPRPPLRAGVLPVAAAQTSAPAAPAPRRVDPRAASFGSGVPLRPAVDGAADSRSGALGGVVALGIREAAAVEAPVSADPTRAPWLALAAADAGRTAADAAQQRIRPLCSCGCVTRPPRGCGCGCGGCG
jgi:hypothetical protein